MFSAGRGPRDRSFPRLTRKVFWDLAIWMIAFGLLAGFVFPPFSIALGVPRDEVITLRYLLGTLSAGFAVGMANYVLARWIVGRRVQTLSSRMQVVEATIRDAMFSGDWSGCDPERCRIEVDSADELGESAAAFNALIEALARSHGVEDELHSFTASMSEHLDVDDLAREALAHFRRVANADAGVLFVRRGGRWTLPAHSGLSEPEGVTMCEPSHEALRWDRIVRVPSEQCGIRGLSFVPEVVLHVPVAFHSAPIGLVSLSCADDVDIETERLVDVLRRTLGVALRNAISHDEMEELAAVDALTGLYNRRFGLARLREEFGRARREASPLGLLIFDVDHFKVINDTCGHLVGDRVLEEVARASRSVIREGDVLMRYGGDEFVAILPLATAPDVAAIGERIRFAVAGSVVGNDPGQVRVTVSIGAAVHPDTGGSTPDQLFRVADEALYEAKTGDRNRLVLAR
ncbi:MAG: diguanylate cyclase [Actinomycetota bacterium]